MWPSKCVMRTFGANTSEYSRVVMVRELGAAISFVNVLRRRSSRAAKSCLIPLGGDSGNRVPTPKRVERVGVLSTLQDVKIRCVSCTSRKLAESNGWSEICTRELQQTDRK